MALKCPLRADVPLSNHLFIHLGYNLISADIVEYKLYFHDSIGKPRVFVISGSLRKRPTVQLI